MQIAKSVQIPHGRVTKPDAQALLHAVEELYYFKRFREGVDFVRRVLDHSMDGLVTPPFRVGQSDTHVYVEAQCPESGPGAKAEAVCDDIVFVLKCPPYYLP